MVRAPFLKNGPILKGVWGHFWLRGFFERIILKSCHWGAPKPGIGLLLGQKPGKQEAY